MTDETHVASEGDARTVNNTMRHQYRVLSEADKATMLRLKDLGLEFHAALRDAGGQRPDMPDGLFGSRELSIAATKVEEAVMWAVKHVTK